MIGTRINQDTVRETLIYKNISNRSTLIRAIIKESKKRRYKPSDMNLNPFYTLTVFVKLIIFSLSNHLEIKGITAVVTASETSVEAEILIGSMKCKQDTD